MKQRMISLKIPLIGSVLFILIIGVVFAGNCLNLGNLVKQEVSALVNQKERTNFLGPTDIEIEYNDDFWGKREYINFNGTVHKALNQKIVNGAIKGRNSKLYLEEDVEYKFNKKDETKYID